MYEIFGRTECIWCDRAKELLDSKGLEYVFLNIEEDEFQLGLFQGYFVGAKTVPQIRIKPHDMWGDYLKIGGYKELYDWLKPSIKS